MSDASSEKYHVSNLMTHYETDPFLVELRSVLAINQHINLSEGDGTPILHGSSSKVTDGNQIQFGNGKRNVEEILCIDS